MSSTAHKNPWQLTDYVSGELQAHLAESASASVLNLSQENLTDEDVVRWLIPFLEAHPKIQSLSVGENRIGPSGAAALAANKTLTVLDIVENQIGSEGAKALAHNFALHSLLLRQNHIGDEGAMALGENQSLTALSMADNQIRDKGAAALAKHKTLTTLDLSDNEIGDDGIIALAHSEQLEQLELRRNPIGTAGLSALAQNKTLTALDMDENAIGDLGAMLLASNRTLTGLSVNKNQITEKGTVALASHPSLIALEIEENQIGAAGAKALAENGKLLELSVKSCELESEEIRSLTAHSTLTGLDLSRNQATPANALTLGSNKKLIELNIGENNLGTLGAIALSASQTLTDLNVELNHIGVEGAIALANIRTLTTLNIKGNAIGDRGAMALALHPTLTDLNIGHNQVLEEGAIALSRNDKLTNLDMTGNKFIGAAGRKALMGTSQRRMDEYIKAKQAFLSVMTITDSSHLKPQLQCPDEGNLNSKKRDTALFRFRAGVSGNRLDDYLLKRILSYAKPNPFLVSGNWLSFKKKEDADAVPFPMEELPESLRPSFDSAIRSGTLTLSWHSLTDEMVVRWIMPFLKLYPTIQNLKMEGNPRIGISGALALANNQTLTCLNVSSSRLKDEAIEALASHRTLTYLDISFNSYIESKGALALAKNDRLETLNVRGNSIGHKGKAALLGVPQQRIKERETAKYAFLSLMTLTQSNHLEENKKCPNEAALNEEKQKTLLFKFRFGPRKGIDITPGKLLQERCLKDILSYVKPTPFKVAGLMETPSVLTNSGARLPSAASSSSASPYAALLREGLSELATLSTSLQRGTRKP